MNKLLGISDPNKYDEKKLFAMQISDFRIFAELREWFLPWSNSYIILDFSELHAVVLFIQAAGLYELFVRSALFDAVVSKHNDLIRAEYRR